MTSVSVCLTLVLPRQLRDELFDYLGEQTDLVRGFTASDAAGYGTAVRLQSMAERVKGHADQVIVWIVLPRNDAERLLDRVRASFTGTNLVYWIQPVAEFGTVD
ncbi:lysophospholipase L1-like esterase [Bradyrhizobium japonicum]|jgi:lysophospholipase L1-like esterase|uniref:DUF3240 family protein n=1 Tax=Bradyrhizobium TaxID=374 RepID=UPI0004856E06|nr:MULTISPECIES: DUF3240 family protein [Bradyrhizobium]MBR0883016.1 DUF3240 family protein [Bradyrhizobium liaoningense]MBR0947326.1 DUF3240 family protein [Bradyrhizobium liaoningense]MBR1003137.1 DUF3240 family protein [Bradyrhizobium liaoningense]MBR1034155.1 DUF3240 family protein [Bradyrhizobium liaoningense]MBR1067568.1 DUF3240 family protein [Bradyrhizobium liaoningense]